MKVSEITTDILREYLRLDEEENETMLTAMLEAAIAQVKAWTNLSDLDVHDDITVAVLVLIGQMYDKRTYTDSDNQENPVISSILDMHRMNLLKG